MWFENEGHRIYYEDEGSGDPVLLLPGFTLSVDDLGALKQALLPRFRVIGAEPPGTGRSGPRRRGYSPRYHEEDARLFLALLRELDAHPAHVVGYSDGGDYALVMALLDPASVQSVVAWGAAGTLGSSMELVDVFRNVLDSPLPAMETYSSYLKASYGEETARAIIDSAAEAWTAIIAAGGDISLSRAGEIACPTLLLAGEHDTLAAPALVAEMAAAMPQGNFVEVEGAGHGIHRERPEWLAATVVDWLTRSEVHGGSK
jgi:valacyclovir hydrolase